MHSSPYPLQKGPERKKAAFYERNNHHTIITLIKIQRSRANVVIIFKKYLTKHAIEL
jgi:hypothetical protein